MSALVVQKNEDESECEELSVDYSMPEKEIVLNRSGLFDPEDEPKIQAGLARIQQLDRKLRQGQARARAVAEQLDNLLDDNDANSCSEAGSLASDAYIFRLTEKRRHRPKIDAHISKKEKKVNYIQANAIISEPKSLLNHDQEMRALQLELSSSEENDAVYCDLMNRNKPSATEAEILRKNDEQLRQSGHADLCFFPDERPENEKAVNLQTTQASTLRQLRDERRQRELEHELDLRLAVARNAPLIILDDDELEQYEDEKTQLPPCVADITALLHKLKETTPELSDQQILDRRARVNEIVYAMQDQIEITAALRAERRRRRGSSLLQKNDDDDNNKHTSQIDDLLASSIPDTCASIKLKKGAAAKNMQPKQDTSSFSSSSCDGGASSTTTTTQSKSQQQQQKKKKGSKAVAAMSFQELTAALHEAALKTTSALQHADTTLRHASMLASPQQEH